MGHRQNLLEQRGANSDISDKTRKIKKNDRSAKVNKTRWQESEYDEERKKCECTDRETKLGTDVHSWSLAHNFLIY